MKTHIMSYPAAMLVRFVFVALISCTFHESLQITPQDYPLMHYKNLISEINFTSGRPLVIVIP